MSISAAPQASQEGPEQQVFQALSALDIAFEVIWHRPVFTVEEGRDLHDLIPGMHCKNLFLKDKKGDLWLVVMPGDKRAALSKLEKRLGCPRLSFGSPDLLAQVLNITPGSVTPFALMHDTGRVVTVILDDDMMRADRVNYHPMRNDASVALSTHDLLRFINDLGYKPRIMNCGPDPDATSP